MKVLLASLTLLFLTNTSFANILGFGNIVCSEYVVNYQASKKSLPQIRVFGKGNALIGIASTGWILGYTSAISQNIGGTRTKDVEPTVVAECNKNPKLFLYEAVRNVLGH